MQQRGTNCRDTVAKKLCEDPPVVDTGSFVYVIVVVLVVFCKKVRQ
jgi:hypothetical protein